jgi:DNA-binding SARP family transcriptional activator
MAAPHQPARAGHRHVWRVAAAAGRGLSRGLQAVVAIAVLGGLCLGLPWALVRFVGWPLPDHIPSLDDLGAVLMTPMSARFLLDTLACLVWLIWFFFALDVAGCLLDVARGARWPELAAQSRPLRRVAATLIGALLLAFLSRTAIAAPIAGVGGATPEGHGSVVATAPQYLDTAATSAVPAGIERVRLPQDGIHDSLYRVAKRCLGDGDRWPELWALNRGSAQPGGRILTTPSLIHPGDLLRLPQAPTPPERPAAPIVPPPAPSQQSEPDPATSPSTVLTRPAVPSTDLVVPSAPAEPVGGVSWGTEVFVSLGLAAAVSAALVAVRRRHRARYRPGSGRRDDDLPVAPVVYQLHLAHLHAQHHDEDDDLIAETRRAATSAEDEARDRTPGERPHGEAASVQVLPRHRRRTLGHDEPGGDAGSNRAALAPEIALSAGEPGSDGGHQPDSQAAGDATLALDLAHAHGLGLVGPGSYAAARALLLTILTTTPAATVVVPVADLTRLLGVPVRANDLPDAMRVVEDLGAELADLESRMTAGVGNAAVSGPWVLVTSPPPGGDETRARLQGLLDAGGRIGITALILGQWRPGVTASVTAAGTITATDPGLGEGLRGTRAFTLPDTAARDLLAFLRSASPTPSSGAAPATSASANPAGDTTPSGTRDLASSSDAGTGQAGASSEPSGPAGPGLEIISTASADVAGDAGRVVLFDDAAHGRPAVPPDSGQAAPLVLSVFGAPTLAWRSDTAHRDRPAEISGGFSRRLTELLVFLAVHPGGVSRDAVVDALWAEHAPRDPASVLRTVVSRIRRAVEQGTGGTVSEIVLAERGRYHLAPGLVEVDFSAFCAAVTRRRAATTEQARIAAYEAIVAAYGGALADGFDAGWLTAAREATRRDALDAVAALARARVHDDPDSTLDLLETARAFDPHNELLYRDIMRLEHTLGRHDAISRTLTLLETRLGEIDATPTPGTVDLAARLRELHTGITTPSLSQSTAHDRRDE